jgi:hypothetical protein
MIYVFCNKYYKYNKKGSETNITCVIVLTEPIPKFRGTEISVIREKAMYKNEAN